jgi:ribosomal protein S18 acetylase RimI-like enzyme
MHNVRRLIHVSVSSTLVVRRFSEEDTDAVWELHNAALASTDAHVGNGPWDEDVRDPGSSYLQRGGEFLVGIVDGDLVAMGAYVPVDSRTIEIKRMRVLSGVQRNGYGTTILRELEVRAREARHEIARLDTTREQVAAQKLYLANGYHVIGTGKTGRFETVIFEKELR